MTVKQLKNELKLEVFTKDVSLDQPVEGGYVGDMLSWVMSHCKKNECWITVLNSINMIAVASLTEASCIILSEGVQPEAMALARAEREGIAVLGSSDPSFDLCIKVDSCIK